MLLSFLLKVSSHQPCMWQWHWKSVTERHIITARLFIKHVETLSIWMAFKWFIVKMQNICNLIGWNSVHMSDIFNRYRANINGYLLKPEWAIGERNEGNDGSVGNQGRNAGNQCGNAGNQGGNAGNQAGNVGNGGVNVGNQGGNVGNQGDSLSEFLCLYLRLKSRSARGSIPPSSFYGQLPNY